MAIELFTAIAMVALSAMSTSKVKKAEIRIAKGATIVSKPNIFDPVIKKYAKQYNVNPSILKSKLYWESELNPKKENPDTGAKGLAQFMPVTWTAIWKTLIKEPIPSPFSVEPAIRASAIYMRYLLDRFENNYAYALAAYNYGETNIRKAIKRYGEEKLVIGSVPYETRSYLYGISKLAETAVI